MSAGIRTGAALTLLLWLAPAGTWAQQPGADGTGSPSLELTSEVVASIQVTSSYPDHLDAAREAIVQRAGDVYSIDAIRASLQNLYALGTVADVRVTGHRDDQGLHLTFVLEPLVRLYKVQFAGATTGLSLSRLRRALSLAEGAPLDAAAAAQQGERVQQALADQGYLLARVRARVLRLRVPTRGVLQLTVDPRARTRLEALKLEGHPGIAPTQVLAALGLKPGAVYRPAQLQQGIRVLHQRLIERGFFYAQVAVAEQSLDLHNNRMSVVVQVDAGPRVDLNISGLSMSRERQHQMLTVFEFGSVDDWALKETRQQIVGYLQQHGYWRPLVAYTRQRDPQGRNVAVQIRVLPGRKTKLTRIEFEGNDSIPDKVLRGAMRSRPSRPFDATHFVSEWWREDQRAVLTVYRRAGFRQARIVTAQARLQPGSGGVVATMQIQEGPRTRIAEVRVLLQAQEPTPGIVPDRLIAQLEQHAGGPFDANAVRRDADRLRALLANLGYPRAVVQSDVQDSGSVSVIHTVHPGERARVARLLIAGNERTRDDVIRRELSLASGSPYAFSDILQSQSRLYRLGLFQQVDVRSAVPDDVATDRDVVVHVQEAAPMFISFGAGLDTDEQLRGLLSFGHNNIAGRNLQATFSARASVREQRVRLLFRDPYFAGHRLESTLSGFYSDVREPSFDVRRVGGSFQLLGSHNAVLSSLARLSFRDVSTSNIKFDPALIRRADRSTRVGSIGYTLVADTRRNLIDPRSGSYHTFDVDLSTRVLGSNTDFVTLFARSFWYRQLAPSVVFAAALRAGIKLPYGRTDNVPLPERFFAGGSTSFRGFALDEAGPRDSAGNPLGGEVLLLGNFELRLPVRDELGVVLFADVGNVFAKPRELTWREIRTATGLGLRYATAVGPIRLDLARLLGRRPGESLYQLFFSVGHTF